VAGAILLVVLLVLVGPIMVMMSGALGAAILGVFLKDDVEETHEGSELIDLNR
jgi:hypothetical protein